MPSSLLSDKLRDLKKIGLRAAVVEELGREIEAAPRGALHRVLPYRLAARLGVPFREVLDAVLYGTRLGIFDLNWEVRCPSCNDRAQYHSALSALRPASHCDYCEIDIEVGFDDAVEVTFQVNENIRDLGEPSWLDHTAYWDIFRTAARFEVPPGQTAAFPLDLKPGTYHLCHDEFLRTMSHALSRPLVVRPGLPGAAAGAEPLRATPLRATFDGGRLALDPPRGVGAGPAVVSIENRSALAASFTLLYEPPFPFLSAAELGTNQDFRDLFLSELISTDESFSIRSQTFAFTDIKGSTALYSRLGDARAYKLVKDHFKILTSEIKRHNGAIVKTIGDAVMAAFHVSRDAVSALLSVQEAFAAESQDEIIIKVGAHRGPCIAVTSNDRLDYFGQTVNIAARVQGLSSGHDIILSQSLYDEPAVREAVSESGWRALPFQAPLKGVSEAYAMVHLLPPRERSAPKSLSDK